MQKVDLPVQGQHLQNELSSSCILVQFPERVLEEGVPAGVPDEGVPAGYPEGGPAGVREEGPGS